MMKRILLPMLLLLAGLTAGASTPVRKVLFIGDSMTGWLSERLEAYGRLNDFEVDVVLWDGSTISKWVNSGKIPGFISTYKPDVVMICLGMNELLMRDPQARLSGLFDKLGKQLGHIPYVWVGPPTWPGKGTGKQLDEWIAANLPGNGHFFNSEPLHLARQSKTNPHPTKPACAQWMDSIVKWLPQTHIGFPETFREPAPHEMKRGKVFIYRRMRESL